MKLTIWLDEPHMPSAVFAACEALLALEQANLERIDNPVMADVVITTNDKTVESSAGSGKSVLQIGMNERPRLKLLQGDVLMIPWLGVSQTLPLIKAFLQTRCLPLSS